MKSPGANLGWIVTAMVGFCVAYYGARARPASEHSKMVDAAPLLGEPGASVSVAAPPLSELDALIHPWEQFPYLLHKRVNALVQRGGSKW